jgi:hypothetical protein
MKKIVLISFAFLGTAILLGVFYFASFGEEYNIHYLNTKYHNIVDLKHAVDTGELNYTRLPQKAKTAIDNFKETDYLINFTAPRK